MRGDVRAVATFGAMFFAVACVADQLLQRQWSLLECVLNTGSLCLILSLFIFAFSGKGRTSSMDTNSDVLTVLQRDLADRANASNDAQLLAQTNRALLAINELVAVTRLATGSSDPALSKLATRVLERNGIDQSMKPFVRVHERPAAPAKEPGRER